MKKAFKESIKRFQKNKHRVDLSTIISMLSQDNIEYVKNDIVNLLKDNQFLNSYYTPNKISELMANLGKINAPKSIIDICCGIGNILTYCDFTDTKEGVDINPETAAIARILNPTAQIHVADSVQKTFDKKYDLVFGDFPFGMKIRKEGKAYPIEGLLVEKGLSILKQNGVLICLVPNGFLFNQSFSKVRSKITKQFSLQMVVSFPGGTIQRTTIRSSLLYIQKSKPRGKIYLADFKNNQNELIDNFINDTGDHYVSKKDLGSRWDKEYHDPEFIKIEKSLKAKETKTIAELSDVFLGYSPKPEERIEKGDYLIVGGRNFKDGLLVRTNMDKFINCVNKPSFKRAILQPGDVIISLLFNTRKICVYKETDPKALLNNTCSIIRSPDNEYISTYLKTLEGQKLFLKQAKRVTKGSVISRLSIQDLKNIKIPIVPIDNLLRLSNREIEKSSASDLTELKNEITTLRQKLEKEKRINRQLKRFYLEREAKIERQIYTEKLLDKLKYGESKHLEFKSTLRWNIHKKTNDRAIENAVLKTIAAFCNSDGGELLIGISDTGEILGIEMDKFKNEDKFILHLRNLITDRIIPSVIQSVDYKIIRIKDKKICKVRCKKSNKDIWLLPEKGTPKEEFYVRTGPSSMLLSPRKAVEYIKERF